MGDRLKLVPLRPPTNEDEADMLRFRQAMLAECARRDQHSVLAATHLFMRGHEVVGYVSLGGMPTMHVWLDSQRVKAPESLRALEQVDAVLADKFGGAVLVPCAEESPFQAHMERLGFERLGPTVLYLRRPTK